MKLQLALDVLTSEEAVDLVYRTREYIDIIEIGTPLIKHEGISIVRCMKKLFPDKSLLVDLKSMDVGAYEADFCFDAGADLVTVLGAADDRTIEGTLESAHRHGGAAVVDLINVRNKLPRLRAMEAMGADYVGIHSGIDQQAAGASPLADLKRLSKVGTVPLAVAGGIGPDTLNAIVRYRPQIVVVGGAITGVADPGAVAQAMAETLRAAA